MKIDSAEASILLLLCILLLQYCHGSKEIDQEARIFFTIKDIKAGKVIPLYFPTMEDISTRPSILPREEVESLPFSSSKLRFLLDFFQISPDSPQAAAMEETIKHCEHTPLNGETKFCATSLESMLDSVQIVFGFGVKLRVLTTKIVGKLNIPLQNYTVSFQKELQVQRMIGCHLLPYPFAVFYCHGQEGDQKVYRLRLRNEEGGVVEAIGVCHVDTKEWDPSHVAFRVLGVKPGSGPICHVFPPDNLVWIPLSAGLVN